MFNSLGNSLQKERTIIVCASIIVDIYGKTKSEEQVYNALMERYGDNEYVKGFPDFIRRSILGQLIRGYVLSLKL